VGAGRPERNVRLILAYDGTEFHGFQRQREEPTVQSAVEAKLERIAGERIIVTAAGRTDAGVHAIGQVINFHTRATIPTERVAVALNSLPPYSIAARDPREVSERFHARFDATSRVYRYLLLDGEASPFLRRYSHRVAPLGDLERLRSAASCLVGRHDFSSFCAAAAEVAHKVRHLTCLTIERRGTLVLVEVTADGFLHSMVRIIVGTLLEVAAGRLRPEAVGEILAARDREAAGPTAPAHGLFLTRVTYPNPGYGPPDSGAAEHSRTMGRRDGETYEDIHGEAG
jgi:tRNA pseudouridine38-40 synthase